MENSVLFSDTEEQANDNIESVRDLLFGNRKAEVRVRTVHVDPEPSPEDELQRVETKIDTKLSFIEDLIETSETRIGSIDSRLKSEAATRIKHDEEFRKSLDKTAKSTADRIASLEDRLDNIEREMKSELQSRSDHFADEMASLREEIFGHIDARFASLSDRTTDRFELGDLLIDLGLKIQPANISGWVEPQKK
ncbi:MAG: hypothetical protein P1V20_05480 [Verrucomicrobiales bacterium]|nr:hypothetical protein [Verrucomicrobiales bacterium]